MEPISLIYLNPRQNKSGVRARKIFRKSAFIAPIKINDQYVYKDGELLKQVFKRNGVFNTGIAPRVGRTGRRGREQIEKQVLEIEDDINNFISGEIMFNLEEYFFKILKQELNFEVIRRR